MTAADDLWLELLTDHTANNALMPCQHMHLIPGPDIPNSNRGIPATREY